MNYKSNTFNVFLGCCLSAFLMEILMAEAPNSANFITFLQFFCISLQGFIFRQFNLFALITLIKNFQLQPKIPFTEYFTLIALFFITSVANNYVYALHVPSTLHMIIRSAASPASMVVSWFVKNREPKVTSALGSVLISIGVALAMYGGARIMDKHESNFIYWCIGVTILLSSLITGAFTGLQQEILYAKYGKHPNEMLFYTHALPMPLFLGIYPQLQATVSTLSSYMWFIVILNIASQFYCTHSVHVLATKESSVTVTLILTLRKFLSLLISSIIFKNTFTTFHMAGTLLVVLGTCVYFDFFKYRKQRPVSFKNE